MMKFVFLDIDGVLNDHHPLASGYCGICPGPVERLNEVLARVPDAMLVLSSAWRYLILNGGMTIKGFEALLLTHGVCCHDRIHGHTVSDAAVDKEPEKGDAEGWRRVGMAMRTAQIKKYLAENSCAAWVAVDDLPLEGLDHFVRTDGKRGLLPADAAAILKALDK